MAADYGHVLVGTRERKIISVDKIAKMDQLFTSGKGVFVFQVHHECTHVRHERKHGWLLGGAPP